MAKLNRPKWQRFLDPKAVAKAKAKAKAKAMSVFENSIKFVHFQFRLLAFQAAHEQLLLKHFKTKDLLYKGHV